MSKAKVYGTEDILILADNVPTAFQPATVKMMMDMMGHEAYNNAK